MEMSNRTLGVVCASIVLFAVAVKTQESPTVQGIAPTPQTVSPIPDSDFSLVSPYVTANVPTINIPTVNVPTVHEPALNLGTPNRRLITQNQSGAIVPGVTRIEDDQPVEMQLPSSVSQGEASEDLGFTGGYQSNLTDTSRLSPFLDSMSDEDQEGFWMMWDTMTPEQRRQFLTNLGG